MYYIKQIKLTNFLSFKDVEIGPFDKRSNVIVGRNGSGKSNIIKALEFVLTDVRETNTQRYAHFRMNPRERTEVEVVIVDYREDDEGGVEETQMHVKRILVNGTDQTFLGDVSVSRKRLMRLLKESNIFPDVTFQIVDHSKVMKLASPKQRLRLLQEASDVVSNIQNQVDRMQSRTEGAIENAQLELNSARDELGEIQENMVETREWNVFQAQDIVLKLAKARAQFDTSAIQLEAAETEIAKLKKEIVQRKSNTDYKALQSCQSKLDRKRGTKRQELQEFKELSGEKTALSTQIARIDAQLENMRRLIRTSENRSAQLVQAVEELRRQLRQVDNNLNIEADQEFNREDLVAYRACVGKLKTMLTTLGNMETDEERNDFIQRERNRNETVVGYENLRISYNGHAQALNQTIGDIESLMSVNESQRKISEENGKQLQAQMNDLKKKLDEKTLQKKKVQNHKSTSETKYREVERKFLHNCILLPQISKGVESVDKIVKENSEQLRGRYYGLVVENFKVSDDEHKSIMEMVVENLAGAKLFHHIVDSIETANFIRDRMRERGYKGKVTFIPLSEMNPVRTRNINVEGVSPALEYVQYVNEVERAIKNVFQNLYIAQDLDNARRWALANRVHCSTLRGQKVLPMGIFEFNNRFFKTIATAKEKLDLKSEIEEKAQEMRRVNESIEKCRQRLSEVTGNRDILYHKLSDLKKEHDQLKQQVLSTRELTALKKKADKRKKEFDNVLYCKKLIELLGDDTVDEAKVQNLECKIDIMEEVLAKLREMEIVNKEKNTSQEQIPIRRAEKEQITAKLAEKEVELTRKQNDLNQIGEQIDELLAESERINGYIDTALVDYLEKQFENLDENKKVFLKNRNAAARIIENTIQFDKQLLDKYDNVPEKNLSVLLAKMKRVLKKMTHYEGEVDYRMIQQVMRLYVRCEDKLEEVTINSETIAEAIIVYLHSETNMFHPFLENLKSRFDDVFKRFFPNGEATLDLLFSDDSRDSDVIEYDNRKLVGIDILARMNEGEEMSPLHPLSGGQKTVLAVCLIRALQEFAYSCVYAFDEIDSALDAENRATLTTLMQGMQQDSQLFYVTFREEMLDVANRIFLVRSANGRSMVAQIEREEAIQIVRDLE